MWGVSSQLLQQISAAAPTLEEGYLLTATPLDLERGITPLGPLEPAQTPLLGRGVTHLSCCPWPRAWGNSSWKPFP